MSSTSDTPDGREVEVTDDAAPALPDARLLEAHDLALEALREITPATSIGAPAGHRVEADGVVSLLFENTLRGYPGWYWTVSLAVVDDAEPTVLEAELLPGESALLAPEWVPWAVRLKEYQAAQAAAAEAEAAGPDAEAAELEDADVDDDLDVDDDDLDDDEDDDLDDDEDDDLEDDEEDFDADGSPILHAGDLDGVDIDELDESDSESGDDEEE